MKKYKNTIYLYFTSLVMVIVGIMLIDRLVLNQIKLLESDWTKIIVLIGILSSIVIILLLTVKRTWIVFSIFLLISIIVVWFNQEDIIWGISSIINQIILKTNVDMEWKLLYINIPDQYKGRVNLEFSKIYLLWMITFFMCVSYVKRSGVVIFGLFMSFIMAIPIIWEGMSETKVLVFVLAYETVIVVMSNASYYKKNNKKNLLTIHKIALLSGVFMFAICSILYNAFTWKDFERSEYFNQKQIEANQLIEDIKTGEISLSQIRDLSYFDFLGKYMPTQISGGSLGQVDELEFKDEEVISVTLPIELGRTYIKGYIGQDYTSTQWIQPNIEGYEEKMDYLQDKMFYSQGMIYLMSTNLTVEQNNYITGYMNINYTAGDTVYQFFPLYPFIDLEIECIDDSGIEKLENGKSIAFISYADPYFRDFNTEMLESINPDIESEQLYRSYVYNEYLEVNTTMEMELRSQWGGLENQGPIDRYNIAVAIREYLESNNSYSLSPGAVPSDKDFVEYFLKENKRGYCTYFATAAVMMFRSAGIPARYVEGYTFTTDTGTVGENKEYTTVSVLDSNAHAWVEYYVDGLGWLDFEVTPGNYEEQNLEEDLQETIEEETQINTPEETVEIETETETEMKPETSDSIESNQEDLENKEQIIIKDTNRIKIIILYLIIILALIVLFLYFRHKKVVLNFEKLYNMKGSEANGVRIILNYNKYEKILCTCGYTRELYMDYVEFSQYLGKECKYVNTEEAKQMAELYEEAIFSKNIIKDKQVEQTERILKNVKDRLFQNMGIVRKIHFLYIQNN